MPRFAANLSMMYPELPFLDRFEAAAKDGFKAVEYLFPYAFAKEELAARLKANGLQQVLFNAPPGGTDAASIDRAWNGGDKGITCIPGREDEFRAGVALALDYAQALGCPRIHLMAGLLPAGVSREAAQRTYVANLRWAAAEAARYGRDVLIEPINTRDIPGFFLNRHEPDIGEVNYPYLFGVIDEVAAQCGWDGWIGCEYKPKRGGQPGGTSAGLGWFGAYRVRS